MKTNVTRIVVGLVLLTVTWLLVWQINFITKHPDDYVDNGLPPASNFHYWPLSK